MIAIQDVSTFSVIPNFVPFGVLYYTQDTSDLYIGTGNSVGPAVTFISGGGGSGLWSSLGNATANLTLANAGFSTTFNQTSAVEWFWANTTLATSSVDQSSPSLVLGGQFWTGAASGFDQWSLQNVVTGSGVGAQGTLQLIHSSTASVSRGQILVNDAAGGVALFMQNNGTTVFQLNGSNSANVSTTLQSTRPFTINGGVPSTTNPTSGAGVTLGTRFSPVLFAPSSGAINGVATGIFTAVNQTGSATGNFTGTLFFATGNSSVFLGTTFLVADFQNDAGSVFQVGVTGAIFPGTVTDSSGSVGTNGQLLSSTVSGVAWVSENWNSPGNATGNLTLANAGFTSTFNQTSAVAWLWANTTVATSGTTNASPLIELAGNYWTGAASAQDLWSIGSSLAAGTNGASTLTIAHSGSTGNTCVQVPAGGGAGTGTAGLGLGSTTVGISQASNAIYIKAGTSGAFANINLQLASVTTNHFTFARNTTGPTYQFLVADTGAAALAVAGAITSGAFPSITLCNNIIGGGSFTGTSGAQSIVYIGGNAQSNSNGGTFAPTSGTATFVALQVNPTINQTGGANGAVTDIMVNSVETAIGGTHNLLDLQAGASGTTSMFSVSNKGVVKLTAAAGAPTSAGTAGTAGQILYFGGLLYFCSVTGAAGSATWNKLNMTAV